MDSAGRRGEIYGTPVLSPSPGSLHEAIRRARQEVPRYLFRAWHPGSGGDARLNTETHVTPRAFFGNDGSDTIFDVDESDLARIIQAHLHGGRVRTLFSSWTPDLSFAVGFAADFAAGAHVAVIDTTKLPARNATYCSGSPHLTEFGFLGTEDEYLVFGVVSGPAYQAVPVECFLDGAGVPLRSFTHQHALTAGDVEQEKNQEVVRIGRCFNERFGLVIVVYLLSVHVDISTNEGWLDKLTKEFVIPSDIAEGLQDNKVIAFMNKKYVSMARPGMISTWTRRTNAAFRALSRRRVAQNGTATENSSAGKQVAADAGQDVEMEDVQPSPERAGGDTKRKRMSLKPAALEPEPEPMDDGVRNASRMSKEVRDLKIDMEG